MTSDWVIPLIATTEAPDPNATFSQRVADNQRRVFQIAYSVLGNAADAEEVAQEAFLRAFQNSGSLREAEKFRAWVARIAFRLALNHHRGARRRLLRDTAWQTTETPSLLDGERDAEQKMMLEALRRKIDALPGKLRSALRLSLVAGMEAEDVGALLGIPAGTVRSRVHAARKLLLEGMK